MSETYSGSVDLRPVKDIEPIHRTPDPEGDGRDGDTEATDSKKDEPPAPNEESESGPMEYDKPETDTPEVDAHDKERTAWMDTAYTDNQYLDDDQKREGLEGQRNEAYGRMTYWNDEERSLRDQGDDDGADEANRGYRLAQDDYLAAVDRLNKMD
jgi:hypothetical protein